MITTLTGIVLIMAMLALWPFAKPVLVGLGEIAAKYLLWFYLIASPIVVVVGLPILWSALQ